ncbi:MAG: ABC transporter permease [Candidatus Xenobia bacterium]|jgi:phospholipid/cholesterol/gamma-HCH transport system permease protein
MFSLFEILGLALIRFFEYVGNLVLLLVEALGFLLRGALRLNLTIQQMAFLGVNSVGIVIMTTTFAGMVMSLQLAHIAVRYGVSNVVGGGVALAMCRELGPMLTAVVVAGRAGAAITAEIGTMKVTEQISALITMAVNPVGYLVVPRFVALLIMMPILTLFSNLSGVVGGAVVAMNSAGVPYEAFFDSITRMVEMDDVFRGLFKAMIFGMEVCLVACYQGLNTPRGAAGVGQATTGSVVVAMIIIFITNYFMSAWLFPVH